MNTRKWISENIVLPLSDLILNQSISKQLNFLLKSQYWSREQIDNYQNERLRSLISHACKNVPYYRELFAELKLTPQDIQTKEDLLKLPVTTKTDLKKDPEKHLASNLNRKSLLYRSSSGSTGEPFQYYKSNYSESFLTASGIRGWYWMGYRLGDKYVKISMNPRSSRMKRVQDKMNNCLYLSSQQLTPEVFDEILKQIIKFDPKFIRCYPTPLRFLADSVNETQKQYPGKGLKAINTTGSTLNQDTRRYIEDIFKTNIMDAYSCEGSAHFFNCPVEQYYHPSEEYAISEFISDNYSLSDKEGALRHITTDLHNYATPFIRYDTQDYVVLGDQKQCKCGRNFANIKTIKGRDSDILITPSGKFLIVENFVAYFEWITEVDQIQVIQEELNKIQIKIVVNEKFNHQILQKIRKYWENYIGNDVNTIIEIVDEIKLTPSGKRRTLIRNPKILIN